MSKIDEIENSEDDDSYKIDSEDSDDSDTSTSQSTDINSDEIAVLLEENDKDLDVLQNSAHLVRKSAENNHRDKDDSYHDQKHVGSSKSTKSENIPVFGTIIPRTNTNTKSNSTKRNANEIAAPAIKHEIDKNVRDDIEIIGKDHVDSQSSRKKKAKLE